MPTSTRNNGELTQDQLIRQVIQGDGNMPAYGKNLSPAETTALVAFLECIDPCSTVSHRRRPNDCIAQ
jgi:ubiquinol-cytochrome c reductase cytochrome b subunit